MRGYKGLPVLDGVPGNRSNPSMLPKVRGRSWPPQRHRAGDRSPADLRARLLCGPFSVGGLNARAPYVLCIGAPALLDRVPEMYRAFAL